MTKGNRQRSNKNKKTTNKVVPVKEVKMKSPKVKKEKKQEPDIVQKLFAKYPVKPLEQRFVQMAQEAAKLSSQYATLVNKTSEVSRKIKVTKKKIKDIKAGKIRFPVFERYDDVTMVAIYDKEEYIKTLRNRIVNSEKMVMMVEAQIAHWYDEYHDSMVRLNTYVTNVLGSDAELHNVMGHRKLGKEIKKEEQSLFEKEFSKNIEDLTDEEKAKIAQIPAHNKKQDEKLKEKSACSCKTCTCKK